MAAFTVATAPVAKAKAMAMPMPTFTAHRVKLECSKGKLSRVRASASTSNVGKMGAALVAASASVLIASNASAMEVLMGGSDGELAFIPSEFQVAPGETIVFKNNAGFPHNVIFDEEEVPEGVDVTAISMPEEDLLNAPGQTYKVTLDKKGTYRFYCSPHQGIGMAGKVTVN